MNYDPSPVKVSAAKEKLTPFSSDPSKFVEALRLCCDFDDNGSTAKALAELEIDGFINVIGLITHITQAPVPNTSPLEQAASHLILALALLNPSINAFYNAISRIYESELQSEYLVDISRATAQFCSIAPQKAKALIPKLIARAKIPEFLACLKAALLGLCNAKAKDGHTFTVELAINSKPKIQSVCIDVLCRIDYHSLPRCLSSTKQCLRSIHACHNDETYGALAVNIPNILKSLSDPDLELIFLELSDSSSPSISPLVVHTLWRLDNECREKSWHHQAIDKVLSRAVLSDADLHWLDLFFANRFRHNVEDFTHLFESWINHQDKCFSHTALPHLSSELIKDHSFLCRCLTRWFNSDSLILNKYAADLVGIYTDHLNFPDREPLVLDKSELHEMSPLDCELTICHIIGHCLIHEQPLLSLVFSATQKTNCRNAIDQMVILYFVTYIYPNYGSGMRDFLKRVRGKRKTRVAQQITQATEPSWKTFIELPILHGTVVTDVEHRKLVEADNKPMASALKAAMDNSILGFIGTKIPLKCALSYITYDQLKSAVPTPPQLSNRDSSERDSLVKPTHLHHTQVSWVLPAQMKLDPLGMEFNMRRLRCIKRVYAQK